MSRHNQVLLCLFFLAICSMGVSLGTGPLGTFDPWQIFQYLWSGDQSHLDYLNQAIIAVRFPRVLVGSLSGFALGMAGTVCQGLFQNNLASPSVLGSSAGAAFFSALGFYMGLVQQHWLWLPSLAFLGCLMVTTFIVIMDRHPSRQLTQILLMGFCLSVMLGAGTSLVVILLASETERLRALLHWLMGGLQARSWDHFYIGIFPIGLAAFLALWLTRFLDILFAGEDTAVVLAVPMQKIRAVSIVTIGLLVGGSVSIAGSVPFLGLVSPHIARKLVGVKHRSLILASALISIILITLADLAARTLWQPLDIEVGILTAIIGGGWFFLLLYREKSL